MYPEKTVVHHESFANYEYAHVSHTWDIYHFSMQNSEFSSPTFSCESHKEHKWSVTVVPSRKHMLAQHVFVFFCNEGVADGRSFKLEVSIIRRDGSKCFTRVKSWNCWDVMAEQHIALIERHQLFGNDRDELLPGDKLTLLCELSFAVDMAAGDSTAWGRTIVKVPECRLQEDLGRLLDTGIGSDVSLCAGGRELRAHKAVLMGRSSVFAAMFANDMYEKETGRVSITDVSYDVLSVMLRFVYTGREPRSDQMNAELLMAADKYNLERLKAMCEKALACGLTVDTAAECLEHADRHNAEHLKARTIAYIAEHSADVLSTAAWKAVTRSQQHLADEVINAISRHFKLSTST